ncbi:D-lactate dehydrogenase [Tahibacter aquaticus]|uniref:D-lactate dehydrogenase n=1 Tax=Tahibacter aquaticus TaxID=520092 RepID=A0A4R6Z9Y8_9GAMM|nr:FAD-linked oxidase C-terminal domain-containing protein [Tahibacter aquaticus]TDR48747.1 D-lactate dehydrogenase [Tahibacter aquaticus]
MSLAASLAGELEALFPDALITDRAGCLVYGYDNSRRQAMPDAVVFPQRHEQVVALVQACLRERTPLIARGRGTNTTGATVPVAGGVVASFERMNRILRIDTANRFAVVEPGVLNGDLQAALKPLGFFWPPDPTSSPYCSIGGNLACNSAGPRAVKYGSPRENTLGLRAVAGTGEEFRAGYYTSKGATGYDLTRLLIGAEGTLALITEATLKLTPLAPAKRVLRATYADIESAAAAVSRIMAQPVTPCALEFLDDEALRLARRHAGEIIPVAGAMLLIEVDGETDFLPAAVDAVARAAAGDGLLEWRAAADAAEVEQLWAARKALSPALRSIAPMKINEDVVVPVSRLPELIGGLKRISHKYAIPIVNFGHAGNGNIHVNLLYRPEDPAQAAAAPDCLAAVFDLVLALDGTLSGEHGIGLVKREFLPRALDPVTLALMQRIKAQFDPAGILNPGKLLPDGGTAHA